jgi:beta-phosphoglucomutase
MLKVALFDYDGTLVNTDALHLSCWNQALEGYGAEIDTAFYIRYCAGAQTLDIARQMTHQFSQVSLSAGELAIAKDALYAQRIQKEPLDLLPGARELLVFLAERRIPTGIVTGAPLSGIHRTLEDHDLLRFFFPIVTRESVTRGKPAPDGYLFGLQVLHSPADEAVSFEDTSAGVRAAKAAGMRSFAVPNAYTRDQDFSAADRVCQDLFEARRFLEE